MPECAKCGTAFRGEHCPACGENAPFSEKMANKQLMKYTCPLITGFVGIVIADQSYPPLDENPPMILALCLFLIPILLQMVVTARKRLLNSFGWLRLVYIYAGSAAILGAALLGLNGLVDRAPVRQVQTSIVLKYITSGRYSTSYHIVVSSWQSGKGQEKLRVNRNAYRAMYVGEPVVVEGHNGLFALPWYGRILPE
jgi:hypothetical protein